MQIERFAAPLFGIVSRGAHLTAYTTTGSGMEIWVARRNLASHTYPGMLDTTVAGGVAAFETPFENIVHEADEEASLPAALVQADARAVGVLPYMSISSKSGASAEDHGLVIPDTVDVFDIEVSQDVICVPKDHEVKEFYLMSVEEIKGALLREEFKTNSAVVMVDFLVRHGDLTSENDCDYLEIATRTHRTLPFKAARS